MGLISRVSSRTYRAKNMTTSSTIIHLFETADSKFNTEILAEWSIQSTFTLIKRRSELDYAYAEIEHKARLKHRVIIQLFDSLARYINGLTEVNAEQLYDNFLENFNGEFEDGVPTSFVFLERPEFIRQFE